MNFPFQPSALQNFVFNPVLDGVTYVATVEWNVYGQRWYLRLADNSGNVVLYKAVASSADPQPLASLSWSRGTASATTTAPLGLPVGSQAALLLAGVTPAGYNGLVLATVTGRSSFTFELAEDPGSLVQLGSYGAIVDLVAGLFQVSKLLYLNATGSFVTVP